MKTSRGTELKCKIQSEKMKSKWKNDDFIEKMEAKAIKQMKSPEDLSYAQAHARKQKDLITDEAICMVCKIKNKNYKKLFGRSLDLHCYDGNHHNLDNNNWLIVCAHIYGCQAHRTFHESMPGGLNFDFIREVYSDSRTGKDTRQDRAKIR